ncbi:MAG: xanthine dehydrogenase family protein molybdopterin-binding subunit [Bradyrhizobiaceae bacterium]|nr:xanthine dehydrogenase family protein molybdopterin-binding subunit [Bradyrhizobiaceae bacterium]
MDVQANSPQNVTLDRRQLLQVAASGGALLISAALAPVAAGARGTRVVTGQIAVTAWVRIAKDNSVTLIASQSEMGQGTTTTLAAALADELNVDYNKLRIEFAPFSEAYRDPVYHWMFTGNSQSISSFYALMREAGAAAREMLMSAAAARLKVRVEALTTEDGLIRHASSNRSLTFGEVASDAANLPVPSTPVVRSPPSIGQTIRRWDIPSKVDGSAVFGIDVTLPNMVMAAVRCAPRFGSTVAKYDAAAIKAKPGIVALVEIPHGLAVVGKTYWQARSALDAADIVWSDAGSHFTSGATLAPVYAQKLSAGPFFTHKSLHASDEQGTPIEAVYEIPFQAHATMEPMNCVAHVADGRCEVWAPTQGVELAQNVVEQVTGLARDKIIIHRTLIGGGFGRRLLSDFLKQALIVAMAVKQPVKLIWSREEDMTHDFYRPGMLHSIAGIVGESGKAIALSHRVVSPSHMLYIFPRGLLPQVKDWTDPVTLPEKIDAMAVEGLLEIPYTIPNQRVEQHFLDLDIPVSVWRTTGHGPNNFVLESFIDELATAAKTDPLVFRRALLAGNPRALKVLDLAEEKSGWGQPSAIGHARGIALASAFGGLVCNVVELSVSDDRIKIHRIVAAVDCGRTLDRGIAESNILGGIVWGLSGLRTEITFENGAARQSNFDGFEPLHLWETPICEVHFIDSGEKLGGTGELGPVPVHAAVCNAVFAATGNRIRALPLSKSGLSLA